MLSKINGICYAIITTLLFFVLPLSVIIIGYFWIKQREKNNDSTFWAKLVVIIAELIALIPLIGVLFFSEDGVLYLFLLPINIIGATVFLIPVVLPIICLAVTLKRKKQNKPIAPIIVVCSITTILFLILSVCWIAQ
ncbi:MAG: hypothetical protein IJF57_03900 [Clostridia bacterium]|nr:hypothetical protein [Clostridia bacterium]